MPFVHVIMEPRDEESKHRTGREVADAVAEGTNNRIDGVQVIFHEVPRSGYVRGTSIASHPPAACSCCADARVCDHRDMACRRRGAIRIVPHGNAESVVGEAGGIHLFMGPAS